MWKQRFNKCKGGLGPRSGAPVFPWAGLSITCKFINICESQVTKESAGFLKGESGCGSWPAVVYCLRFISLYVALNVDVGLFRKTKFSQRQLRVFVHILQLLIAFYMKWTWGMAVCFLKSEWAEPWERQITVISQWVWGQAFTLCLGCYCQSNLINHTGLMRLVFKLLNSRQIIPPL